MDLRQLLGVLRRQIWIIVASTVIGAVGAFIVSQALPTTFEARASLIAPTMASTYAEVAESRPVLEQVIAEQRLTITPEDLARNVAAVPSQTSSLLLITVRDAVPARAAAIANAIADRVVALAPEVGGHSPDARAALERDLATVQAEIERIQAAIANLAARPEPTPEDLSLLEAYRGQLVPLLALRVSLQDSLTEYFQFVVRILAPAVVPTRPISPSVVLATLSGALVGFAIGLVFAVAPAALRARTSTNGGSSQRLPR